MEKLEEVTELVKTVLNLCLIYLLIAKQESYTLLPTILELMHETTQQIIDLFCIEEE